MQKQTGEWRITLRPQTIVAVVLIVAGLATNVYVVSHVFSPDGEISSSPIRVFIWIWNTVCVTCGVILLKYRNTLTLKHLRPTHVVCLVIATVIALCLAEAALRVLGYEPWHGGRLGSEDMGITGGTRYSVVDSALGHTIMPGVITITMPTGLRFSATHEDNRSRRTHPLIRDALRPGIWTLGCSFTYGWGVNDSGSYPWKLQEHLPGYDVVNFGVSGYGTLQSFLWFQRNLKTVHPPVIAIMGYVPWHEERNVLARSWKKNLSAYEKLSFMKHPYGFLDDTATLCVDRAPIQYTGLPLIRYSAYMNLLDDLVNSIDLKRNGRIELTATILDSFSVTARRAGTIPVIAFMMDDPVSGRLFAHCRKRGIGAVDVSVDLSHPENSLLPLDPHPSARAHEQYAEKLYAFLREKELIEPGAGIAP